MQFTRQISTLTASAVAAKQCAQFALKNRDFDEDLFSVILEQLESVSRPAADAVFPSRIPARRAHYTWLMRSDSARSL